MKLRLSEIERMLAAAIPAAHHATEKGPAAKTPAKNGASANGASQPYAGGYSIDSRTLQPDDLFFAIRGPNHDGHDHVESALQRGAVAAVVSSGWLEARRAQGVRLEQVIAVDDPAAALRRLATQARAKWGKPIIAVTGSNGKTTTKETISALLETRLRVSKTVGNLNNDLGVPLSILRMDDDAEAGVLEMGMNHRGEIRKLAAIAHPTVGVVTNVNAAHLEFFSSVDEIALAKRELIESLGPQGVAVLNAGDERVREFAQVHPGMTRTFAVDAEADFQATQSEPLETAGMRFQLRWITRGGVSRETPLSSPLPGRHNVANVAAAVAVASVFGIEPPDLVEAVAKLKPYKMRGEFVDTGGIKILNDSYNANPAAMIAMLDVLQQMNGERRVAVLGEMRELGPASRALHREVGQAAAKSADILIAVQGDAKELAAGALAAGMNASNVYFHEDAVAAGIFLKGFLKSGDTVLFKASRGVGLERAVQAVS